MTVEEQDFLDEEERLSGIAALTLKDLDAAEEIRLAKLVQQRGRAGFMFAWDRCPEWEEDEASPGLGIPWRDPRPGSFRYYSIAEIEAVLLRGHY